MKTLVVGLGNSILTDDGAGIHVVQALAPGGSGGLSLPTWVQVAEASVGGVRLLDLLTGFDRVVLVDAIRTPGGQPGEVYRLGLDDVKWTLHTGSTHDLSLSGALVLGRSLGMDLPDDEAFAIIAIEAEDVVTFGEACTPAVTAAIPRAVERVLDELGLHTVEHGEPSPAHWRAGPCV